MKFINQFKFIAATISYKENKHFANRYTFVIAVLDFKKKYQKCKV